jgi:hypothetical protein
MECAILDIGMKYFNNEVEVFELNFVHIEKYYFELVNYTDSIHLWL